MGLGARLTTESVKNANPVSGRGILWWLLLLLPALAGCGAGEPAATPAPKTVFDHFEIKVGDRMVRMQLAVLEPEMQRGLMERLDLGADDGMLFVYVRPQRMSFWMHNTPLPLDIGFFNAEGELREIYPLHPFDEKPVASHGDALQFALEMNQGWFQANGVRPGAKLDLTALRAALQARGFELRRFGLGN